MGRHFGPPSLLVVIVRLAAASWLLLPVRAQADDAVEVEVRGEALGGPSKEPSVAGSVVREERLRAPGLTASDVLRTQPSVTVVDTGGYGALSTASIRGATAAQTPVYLAGIRLNDDVGGTADLSLVPLWFVRRVEIYRSNAPLAGDRLGIGGAIFFEPRLPKKSEAGAGAMVGSFGTNAIWARAGVGNDDASALIGVRRDAARNDYAYLNDNGTRFDRSDERTVRLSNAEARTLDVWAVASTRLGRDARINAVINSIDRDQGLPGFALFPSKAARAQFARHLAAVSSSTPCGSSCSVSSTASLIATHTRYEDPLNEAGFGAAAIDFDGTRVDNATSLSVDLGRAVTLTPSIAVAIEQLKLAATGKPQAHARRSSSRLALQTAWAPAPAITLRALASGQCDGTQLDGRPPGASYGDAAGPVSGSPSCHQFEPSARVGAELVQGPFTFLANLGRYVRVPTLTELYGFSATVRGNPGLVPEEGTSFELGVRAAASTKGPLRGASLDLFGFARTAKNLVAFVRGPSYVQPQNVDSARVMGLELLASYSPVSCALLELAVTMLDPRTTSAVRPANDILPYQQRLTLAPRAELRGAWPGLLSSARVGTSLQLTSSRYGDAAGLVVIPGQRAWEADAELGLWRDRLTLRGRVTNLLNETHFDLVGYPLPGRAVYVAMEAQW
jgi:vitamin B12 transporter